MAINPAEHNDALGDRGVLAQGPRRTPRMRLVICYFTNDCLQSGNFPLVLSFSFFLAEWRLGKAKGIGKPSRDCFISVIAISELLITNCHFRKHNYVSFPLTGANESQSTVGSLFF